VFLFCEDFLLFDADGRGNAQAFLRELTGLLLKFVLHLALSQEAALEFGLIEDLRLGAWFGEVGREDRMLSDLRKSNTLLLVYPEYLAE
jgi:hypothetical protein